MRYFKRIFSTLLILAFTLSLFACAKKRELPEDAMVETHQGFTYTYLPQERTLIIDGKGALENLLDQNWNASDLEDAPHIFDRISGSYLFKLEIGEGITALKDCFNNHKDLNEVLLPRSLKTIENSFQYCAKLEKAQIGKKVERINNSFLECKKLTDLTLLCSATIEGNSFYKCKALARVDIPKNSVLCNSFQLCDSLAEIHLGANVSCHDPEKDGCRESFIGRYNAPKRTVYAESPLHKEAATAITAGIAELQFEMGDTQLVVGGKDRPQYPIQTAFDEESGTLTISGKGRLAHLYPARFYDMAGEEYVNSYWDGNNFVKKIVISEGITAIEQCFASMNALLEIELPKSLQSIQSGFVLCQKLEKLELPEGCKKITNESFYCPYALEKLELPANIEIDHSFSHPEGLKELHFAGKAKIQTGFNSSTALQEVTIPAGSELCCSFNFCSSLKKVVLEEGVSFHETFDEKSGGSIDGCEQSFEDLHPSCTIYLSQELYQKLHSAPDRGEFYGNNPYILDFNTYRHIILK